MQMLNFTNNCYLKEENKIHMTKNAIFWIREDFRIENNPALQVSDVEFSMPRPSYTIDTLAYLKFIKVNIGDDLINKCMKIKYNMVFVLPPWKKIYQQDDCRYESFEESIKIFNEIIKIYEYFEMNTIILKQGTIEDRVDKILSYIK